MSDTTPPPPPPDAPSGGTQRPPLRRVRDGRILTGLGAGLARHFGMDVSVMRILLVLIALVTNGLGLLAYLIGSLVVPTDDEPDGQTSPASATAAGSTSAPAERRDPTFWVGVALLVVASVWLLAGPASPGRLIGTLLSRDVLLAVVLVGFGFALWRSGERSRPAGPDTVGDSRPHPAPPATFAVSSAPTSRASTGRPPALTDTTAQLRPSDPSSETTMPTTTWTPPPVPGAASDWTPPPAPIRERSILGRATLGATFLVVGTLWLLRAIGVLHLGPVQLIAAALLVIGVGLVVGAFVGRARWLIVIGALLVPIVLLGALLRPVMPAVVSADLVREGGGDVRVAPSTAEELQSDYRLGGGRLVVDLTELDVDESAGVLELDLDLGAGELIVILPDDVTASISGRVGIGELRIDDVVVGGLGLSRTQVVEVGDGSVDMRINLRVGAGQLTVRVP